MYLLKCPKCNNGKMLATKMKRGWGKSYYYVCNSCGHSIWLYDNFLKPLPPNYMIIKQTKLITSEEAYEELRLNYSKKDNKYILFIGIIILSVFFAYFFENLYLLIFALLSFVGMYYYGFLDISTHRRDRFFKDQDFEKEIDSLIVKTDFEGKPII